MKYTIEIRTIWEYGQRKDDYGRPHQEDSIFPAHGQCRPSDRLFILCDGMGGHAAGEVASATVCAAMSAALLPERSFYSEDDMARAVAHAYDALDAIDSGADGKKKMGTTMACLALHEGGATMAHMGDSRIYHIRPGREREDTVILFQSRDHSLVNDLLAMGEITPEQALNYPRKNVVTRALQPHMERRQSPSVTTTADIAPGDWFYICSDGMLEQMDDNAIRFIFSDSAGNIDSKTDMLLQTTRDNRDNHTAFVIHVLDVEGAVPPVDRGWQPMPPQPMPPLMGQIEESQAVPRRGSSSTHGSHGVHSSPSKVRWVVLAVAAVVVLVVGCLLVRGCLSHVSRRAETDSLQPSVAETNANTSSSTSGSNSSNGNSQGKNSSKVSPKKSSKPAGRGGRSGKSEASTGEKNEEGKNKPDAGGVNEMHSAISAMGGNNDGQTNNPASVIDNGMGEIRDRKVENTLRWLEKKDNDKEGS